MSKAESNRRYRERHREKVNADARAWRAANPEKVKAYRVASRDATRAWKAANRERLTAQQQAWVEANRDNARRAASKWKKANPEKVRASARARYAADRERFRARGRFDVELRRARKAAVQHGGFGVAELAQKMAYWGERCWICAGPFQAVDHVKPIAKGGSHLLCNLRPICTSCNSSKQHKWDGPAALKGAA